MAWLMHSSGCVLGSAFKPSRELYFSLPHKNQPKLRVAVNSAKAAPSGAQQNLPNPSNPQPDADQYFKSNVIPAPFVGPVVITRSQGRGRGIVAARNVQAGELLLVSSPLGVVYGEDLEVPVQDNVDVLALKTAALVKLLHSKRYHDHELTWLKSMNSAGSAAAGSTPQQQRTPELQASPSQPEEATHQLPASFTEQRLTEIVRTNAFEAAMEDADLAYCSDAAPREEVLGLWPHYSLLNHSCIPNTVSYSHWGMLFTRAARQNMSKGSELFANYIGDLLQSPVSVRQDALKEAYGFQCGCPRCKEESALDKDLQQLVADVYEACSEQVREDLESAIEYGDTGALESLKDQLAAFVEVLDAAFQKKRLPEKLQTWLQASLFEVYELTYAALEALGETDLRLLDLLQALVGAVQPGSELHCFYAYRYLQATQSMEPAPTASTAGSGVAPRGFFTSDAVRYADKLCNRALTTRYGPLSRATYQRILTTRQQLEEAEDEEGEE